NGTSSDALQTEGGSQKSLLRSHPLFFGITMGLLSEIINSRLEKTGQLDHLGASNGTTPYFGDEVLKISKTSPITLNIKMLFTTVRDSLGLTYDVSFELNLFDRLKLGWYVISVTSTPSKVHKAVDACKNVLRGLHSNQITERELDRVST
ncbi:insulinase (peptidase family M16), partial [Trifolium medium]|nr:insulinase (peptidase family M16) [Trifolium medium]